MVAALAMRPQKAAFLMVVHLVLQPINNVLRLTTLFDYTYSIISCDGLSSFSRFCTRLDCLDETELLLGVLGAGMLS